MPIDPALTGLLGALVGGGFTFAGSIIGNTQQARHERRDRLEARKVEAYSNAMRCLLRAGQWRPLHLRTDDEAFVEGGRSWFEEFVDAEYWVTVLSAISASHHRNHMREVSLSLLEMVQSWDDGRTELSLDDVLRKAYKAVAAAAADDIGTIHPGRLARLTGKSSV